MLRPAQAILISVLMMIAGARAAGTYTFNAAFSTDGSNHFDKISSMEEIPGSPGNFIVAEMTTGNLWILSPGTSGYTKTLLVKLNVSTADPDMGLGPIAFHPDFVHTRKYYVKYGDPDGSKRTFRIDEMQMAPGALKDAGKPPRNLLMVPQPYEFKDHNGGGLAFGRDGYLYIGIGDGGWDQVTFDKYNNGQNRETLLAKILRIDVDHQDAGLAYAIPSDNPFIHDADPKVRKEIYAYGLRNPYRISMDRSTGDLYVGDVGLDKFEKVYRLHKGANYGWKLKEYTYCFVPGTCDSVNIEAPAGFASYGPVKCFIGGQVYRGNPNSPLYGTYIFGDHTMKRLLSFKPGNAPVTVSDLAAAPTEMTGFTLTQNNEFYMVGYVGVIYKLDHPDLTPGATTALHSGPASASKIRNARLEVSLGSGPGGFNPSSGGSSRGIGGGSEAVFGLTGKRLDLSGATEQGSSAGGRAHAAARVGLVIVR